MTPEGNTAIARRIPLEAFGQGNLDVVDEVMAPDYIEHVSRPPGFPSGTAGLKQFITGRRAAFPDLHYMVEDEVAVGDRVVLRVMVRGTNLGPLPLPPHAITGKSATWGEIHICRMADGQIAEHWAEQDLLGMMQQLGLIPGPGGPPQG